MRWQIFAHQNAISKNVHSVAVARLRVFTQPRPKPALRHRKLTQCERIIRLLIHGDIALQTL